MYQFNPSKNYLLSMTLKPPTQELEFVSEGIDNPIAVMGQALMRTPASAALVTGIVYRQDIKLTRQGVGNYLVTVPYAGRDPDKASWDYDTTGGTFEVKASKQTIASYVAAGEAVTDHKGAIGRQLDGSVEGVPIIIPSLKINTTKTWPYGVITPARASIVASLTGMVNSTPFFNWSPGEVLFLGGRGADGTETEATESLSFAVEANLQDKIVGGVNVARKDGWDVLWIEFKQTPSAGFPISKPKQINVERVYERVDLAGLLGLR